jgi:hypothetical protein
VVQGGGREGGEGDLRVKVDGPSVFGVFRGEALFLRVMEGVFGTLKGLELVLDEPDNCLVILHSQSSLFFLHPIL